MATVRPLLLVAQLLMVVGILSNSLTAVIYLKSRSLRKPINCFLITLAFSDLFTMLSTLCQPYILKNFNGQFACDLLGALLMMGMILSMNCFAATAVIRYIHIVHPAFSKKILKWKTCFFTVALMWLEDVLVVWPVFTDFTKSVHYKWLKVCSIDNAANWPYYMCMVVITVTVPNVLIIYCYASILVKRLRSKRQVQANSSANSGQTVQGEVTWNKKDLRLFWQIFWLFIVFTVCWTPISVVAFTMDFKSPEHQLLFEIVFLVCLWNFSVNPLVYMYFNHEFKTEIVRTFLCQKQRVAPVSDKDLVTKNRKTPSTCRTSVNHSLEMKSSVQTSNVSN